MSERAVWVCTACVWSVRCLRWACYRASCVVCVVTTTTTPVMIWQHSTVRSPPAPVCSSWTISCLPATVTPATTRHSSACDTKVISLSHVTVRPRLPAWSSQYTYSRDCNSVLYGICEAPLCSVRQNVCNLSKNVKSHVFWIFKTRKNVKNVTT